MRVLQFGGDKMFKLIIGVVLLIIILAICPKIIIVNAEFSDSDFKLIKIKRFSFLFNGLGFESSKKHGIIKECLVMQIFGYLLSLISLIVSILWIILLPEYKKYLFAYFGCAWGIEVVVINIIYSYLKRKARKMSEMIK